MGKFINLEGYKFGKLTVIKNTGLIKNTSVLWECKCECGNTIVTDTRNLKAGITLSCGCYNQEKIMKSKKRRGLVYDNPYESIYRTQIYRANKRGKT